MHSISTSGIPKLPNLNRGQWPDEPEIGLTPLVGKRQMIPKWDADGHFHIKGPVDSGRCASHKIPLAMMSNHW